MEAKKLWTCTWLGMTGFFLFSCITTQHLNPLCDTVFHLLGFKSWVYVGKGYLHVSVLFFLILALCTFLISFMNLWVIYRRKFYEIILWAFASMALFMSISNTSVDLGKYLAKDIKAMDFIASSLKYSVRNHKIASISGHMIIKNNSRDVQEVYLFPYIQSQKGRAFLDFYYLWDSTKRFSFIIQPGEEKTIVFPIENVRVIMPGANKDGDYIEYIERMSFVDVTSGKENTYKNSKKFGIMLYKHQEFVGEH